MTGGNTRADLATDGIKFESLQWFWLCWPAAWGRLFPKPPSFASEFRISISNPLPALSYKLIFFMGLSEIQGQERVTRLFSSTHWEHFFAPLFSISHWEVSSFLTSCFHRAFVFIDLLGAILRRPSRLGPAPLCGVCGRCR